jgi:hypothetical protein
MMGHKHLCWDAWHYVSISTSARHQSQVSNAPGCRRGNFWCAARSGRVAAAVAAPQIPRASAAGRLRRGRPATCDTPPQSCTQSTALESTACHLTFFLLSHRTETSVTTSLPTSKFSPTQSTFRENQNIEVCRGTLQKGAAPVSLSWHVVELVEVLLLLFSYSHFLLAAHKISSFQMQMQKSQCLTPTI